MTIPTQPVSRPPTGIVCQADVLTLAAGRRRGRPAFGDSPVSIDEILLAALQAFAERGYDGMSLRDLNSRLGVSHNLIFQRVGRKDRKSVV